MSNRIFLIAGAIVATLAGPAQAAPLSGSFSVAGFDFTFSHSDGQVTSVDFDASDPAVDDGTMRAGAGRGDFAGIGGAGTIRGFAVADPPELVWTIQSLGTSFTFTAHTMLDNRLLLPNGDAVMLAIDGVITADGYDDTQAFMLFTGNQLGLTSSWSASIVARPVAAAEPASTAVLGAALSGLIAARRRRGNNRA